MKPASIGGAIAAFAVPVALAATPPAAVEDVPTPRGVTVRILVAKPENPWVTLLVFTGGQGDLWISDKGEIGQMKGNFLIRTNDLFLARGAATAIIDTPSDRSNLSHFRDTETHARDVGAVIRHLRTKFGLPVWVIGTSNGSTSAANAGALLTAGAERPDGVVLTSSRFLSDRFGTSVIDLAVDRIAVPVLIAHHRNDNCRGASPDRVPALLAKLKNAKPAKALLYEGASGITAGACEGRHYHGFVGIEDKVVADIMAWIRNPSP